MNEGKSTRADVLSALHRAIDSWICKENEQPLTRWLGRELDREGRLTRLPIVDWHACLAHLLNIWERSPNWPATWQEPITRLNQAVRRYSRPDGSPVTGFEALN